MKTARILTALILVLGAASVPDSPAQVVVALDVDERNVAPTTLSLGLLPYPRPMMPRAPGLRLF